MEQVLSSITPVGVTTGIISALIFLFIVFIVFRPWILIGGHICKTEEGYRFKIINLTPFRCTEFKLYLRKVVLEDSEKGSDLRFEMLEQKENPFVYIPSVFSSVRASRPNCIQLNTTASIEEIIKNHGTYIEIVVIAKHSLSSLQSITRKRFKHSDCIDTGKFVRGFSFKISKK